MNIFEIFKGASFGGLTNIMSLMAPVIAEFEASYLQDKNARNALIDTLIDILQKHKV